MKSIISRRELFRVMGTGAALLGISAASAIAGSSSEPTDKKIAPECSPCSSVC